ncbi:MAG: hypothetical protein WKG01_08235 [Kofleriaceae bacterium]
MRRSAAIVGSIVVHAVILAIVLLVPRQPRPVAREAAPRVAMLTPIDLVPLAATPVAPGGGAIGGGAPVRSRPRVRPASVSTDLSQVSWSVDRGDSASGLGTGRGNGLGGGPGAGSGFGLGGANLERAELPPPPPPPPPIVSKARPAKLVYPTREREAEDGEPFVARVIVDHEGYVVGAHLVRGQGGRRDEVATEMIWKFRYAPALDDAGMPVRSTLDQPFLVQ